MNEFEKELIGQRFGRLTVLKELPIIITESGNTVRKCLCICDCGNTKEIRTYDLKSNKTKSCGCIQKEKAGARFRTHGKSNTKLYHTWFDMKHRCLNKNNSEYKNYGGRGIGVCEEWLGEAGFFNFEKWALNNGYKTGLTLDRIDNNSNYAPDNCRWVTMKEQQRNRSDNVRITYKGETKCIVEWAEITGLSFACISYRLHSGWSPEEILETSLYGRRHDK